MTTLNNLHTLVYLSTASEIFQEKKLEEILSVSRKSNSTLDITGMLVYGGGNFIQVLEGEKDTIHGLYAKIKVNPAHHGFITLIDKSISSRIFADWSMGYKSLNTTELGELEGYINTRKNNLKDLKNSSDIIEMLKAFIVNNT